MLVERRDAELKAVFIPLLKDLAWLKGPTGSRGSTALGATMVAKELKTLGVPGPFRVADGSGLSILNRTSAQQVSSLLVASAGSGASPGGRAAFLAETEQMAAAFRADGMAAVSAKQAMGPNRIQLRRKNCHVWEEFAGQLAEHSAEGMALTVIGIQRSRPSLYDITDQLAGITTPTLVVNGDEDEACLEPGLLLKRTIPTAGLVVVPNSGHALNLEEPGLFNDLIRTLAGAAEAGTWPTRDPRSLSASMGIANAGTGA